MSDDEPKPGSAEDQGPVTITPELADRLAEKRTELFEEFEIRDEFPNEVLREAETRTEDVYEEIEAEIDERKDLRDLTTWTTDPIDAQDFDDAISIEREEGAPRLWVHIADVTHYVTPDTAMWEEAVKRANTVYLPDYTIHMLPPVLAETVCSLVPNEDRLAHTVEMEIDDETLSFEDIDIYKSVINSDERLTYKECEERLEDLLPLGEENELAYELADRMHEQRKEDGSLVLNPSRDRAHTIIEESMLKANKAVTHTLMWDRGVEAMYRVHPQPTPDQWSKGAPRDPRARRGLDPRRRVGDDSQGRQRRLRDGSGPPAQQDPTRRVEGDAPSEVHERPVRRPPRAQLRHLRSLYLTHPAALGHDQPLDRPRERRAGEHPRTVRSRQ